MSGPVRPWSALRTPTADSLQVPQGRHRTAVNVCNPHDTVPRTAPPPGLYAFAPSLRRMPEWSSAGRAPRNRPPAERTETSGFRVGASGSAAVAPSRNPVLRGETRGSRARAASPKARLPPVACGGPAWMFRGCEAYGCRAALRATGPLRKPVMAPSPSAVSTTMAIWTGNRSAGPHLVEGDLPGVQGQPSRATRLRRGGRPG